MGDVLSLMLQLVRQNYFSLGPMTATAASLSGAHVCAINPTVTQMQALC